MKPINDVEDSIDIIRDKIYEEIKNMTHGEETAYFNNIAEAARKKHNFYVVKSVERNTAEAIHSGK